MAMLTAGLAVPASAPAAGSLYVSSLQANAVAQFDIGPTGGLTAKAPAAFGAPPDPSAPDGIAITPDGRSVYVSNGAVAATSQFDVGAGGLLAHKSPASVAGHTGTGRMAISPDGKSLYVPTDATISQFDIGPDGKLSPKAPAFVTVPSNRLAVAIAPDGTSLYASGTDGRIDEFDVGPTGALTPKTPPSVTPGGALVWMAINPDGQSLYAPDFSATGGVKQLDIGADGSLSPKATLTVPVGSSPVAIDVAPDGRHAYVTKFTANEVVAFDIAADGSLVSASATPAPTGPGPVSVLVSANGRNLYVGNFETVTGDGTTISQYDIGSDGHLASKVPPTVTSAKGPWWMVATPDQGPVASFTATPRLGGATFDGTSSSDPDGTVATFDWDFGDGQTLRDGGPTPQHLYDTPGDHMVKLTVTDASGCSTRVITTGHSPGCVGSPAAVATRVVTVPAVFRGLIVKRQAARVRRGRALIKATCPAETQGGCTGTLVLRRNVRAPRGAVRRKASSRVRFAVAPGARTALKPKLNRGTRRALKAARRHRLSSIAVATAADGLGQRRTTTARVTLVLKR